MKEKIVLILDDINDYDNTVNKIYKMMEKIIVFYRKTENLSKFVSNMLIFFYTIYIGLLHGGKK